MKACDALEGPHPSAGAYFSEPLARDLGRHCHALTHFFFLFALDGLAANLEKGYRPAGDLIIEDADYQPAGIPSLCIEVCPTFYRTLNW
jgi:hypothetical protein